MREIRCYRGERERGLASIRRCVLYAHSEIISPG